MLCVGVEWTLSHKGVLKSELEENPLRKVASIKVDVQRSGFVGSGGKADKRSKRRDDDEGSDDDDD